MKPGVSPDTGHVYQHAEGSPAKHQPCRVDAEAHEQDGTEDGRAAPGMAPLARDHDHEYTARHGAREERQRVNAGFLLSPFLPFSLRPFSLGPLACRGRGMAPACTCQLSDYPGVAISS